MVEVEREREPNLKVAIVGGNGTIGTVLQDGLVGYTLTSLDLPEVDARDYDALVHRFRGNDVVIHLALDPQRENSATEGYEPDNSLMTYNVYQAALNSGVRRVIMASSVHADSFRTWENPEKLTVEKTPEPDSPYGANKVFMETMGRYYASKGLEVICIRFGGAFPNNTPPEDDPAIRAVWLSHEDCLSTIDTCLKAETVPHNFAVFYAISNNRDRIHDVTNPFGWEPTQG